MQALERLVFDYLLTRLNDEDLERLKKAVAGRITWDRPATLETAPEPTPQLMIGTPTTRAFEVETVSSLITTRFFYWCPVTGHPADIGRNMVVDAFLRHEAKPKFLIFADSDAVWSKEAAERLVSRDLPLVCATFFRRAIPPTPTCGLMTSRTLSEDRMLYDFGITIRKILERMEYEKSKNPDLLANEINNEIVFEQTPDDLFKIDGCGMHFTCIRRDVFEKVDPPWFKNFGVGGGEDFYFTEKVRKAGIDMYLDLSVYAGHMAGPGTDIGLRDFLVYATSSREQIQKGEGETWKI